MRYILIFWAAPMGIFWSWYFLSANDISFGYKMLTREIHDFAFKLYGAILGIEPTLIPGMVARACVFDTFLIFGILAFRRRREIKAWIRRMRGEDAPLDLAVEQPVQPSA
ncbi:MAG: DUF6105 family protein [Rhizobiaceae bacterium]